MNLDWLDDVLDSGVHDLHTFDVALEYAEYLRPWNDVEARAAQVLSGDVECVSQDDAVLLRRYDTNESGQARARRSIFCQATFANEKVDWAFANGSMEAGLQAGLAEQAVEAPFLRLKPKAGEARFNNQ